MLARLSRRLPVGDGLVYEPKWDGFRCLVFRDGGEVDLRSHQRPLARYFPDGAGRTGYIGPMPPEGSGVHHYHFKVYALDTELEAEAGLTKDRLLEAMEGHILADGELIGTYER